MTCDCVDTPGHQRIVVVFLLQSLTFLTVVLYFLVLLFVLF
jgi:hypothetical protein